MITMVLSFTIRMWNVLTMYKDTNALGKIFREKRRQILVSKNRCSSFRIIVDYPTHLSSIYMISHFFVSFWTNAKVAHMKNTAGKFAIRIPTPFAWPSALARLAHHLVSFCLHWSHLMPCILGHAKGRLHPPNQIFF